MMSEVLMKPSATAMLKPALGSKGVDNLAALRSCQTAEERRELRVSNDVKNIPCRVTSSFIIAAVAV